MPKLMIVQAERGLVDADLIEHHLGFKPSKGQDVFLTECNPTIEESSEGYESLLLVGECTLLKTTSFTSINYIDLEGDVNGELLTYLETVETNLDSVGVDQSDIGDER